MPRRRVRAAGIILALVLAVSAASYVIFRRAVSYEVPDGSSPSAALAVALDDRGAEIALGAARLEHRGTVTVLHLDGEPHDTGSQHGRLVSNSAVAMWRTLAPAIDGTVTADGIWSRWTRSLRLRWRWRHLDEGIPGHQLVEIAGLVRGATGGTDDYERAVRTSAVLDVGRAPVGAPGHSMRAMTRALSVVARSQGPTGDRLLIGRTLAVIGAADGGELAAQSALVSFVHSPDALAFASIGWPGQSGVVTGVNEAGIAVMVHPARTAAVSVNRAAQPTPLIARELLENVQSLDEAVAALEAATPLGACVFLVVDGRQRSIAVVELDPGHVEVLRPRDRIAVGDLLTSETFGSDPLNDWAQRSRPSAARVRRADKLLGQGAGTSPEEMAALLRDHRAADGGLLPVGHRFAIDDISAAHVAILDPSAMVMWVADGPGASSRFRAFDLRHGLLDQGQRPAPPPEIEAGDSEGVRAALIARRLTIEAAVAWERGQRRHAREASSRAVLNSPDLPEALLTAGELARRDGDRTAAQQLFQRYLKIGPDDPEAAVQVEAFVRGLAGQ